MNARPQKPARRTPSRTDAQHNRQCILEAAQAMFDEHGLDASTADVAQRAGVGIGTVFRHFPTKAALIAALLLRRQQDTLEQARALLTEHDPGSGLFAFCTLMVDQAPGKKVFLDVLAQHPDEPSSDAEVVVLELKAVLAALLTDAQNARTVRMDIDLAVIWTLLTGICRAAQHQPWSPEVQDRALDVLFAGLQPHHEHLPKAKARPV